MNEQSQGSGRARRRRRDGGGFFKPQASQGGPAARTLQRVWKCPSCGRTRPGAGADARAPLCRNDLSEMRIAMIPAARPFRPFYRPR